MSMAPPLLVQEQIAKLRFGIDLFKINNTCLVYDDLSLPLAIAGKNYLSISNSPLVRTSNSKIFSN